MPTARTPPARRRTDVPDPGRARRAAGRRRPPAGRPATPDAHEAARDARQGGAAARARRPRHEEPVGEVDPHGVAAVPARPERDARAAGRALVPSGGSARPGSEPHEHRRASR